MNYVPQDFLIDFKNLEKTTLTKNLPKTIQKKFEISLIEGNYTNCIFFGLDIALSNHVESFFEKLLDIFLRDFNVSNLYFLECLFTEVSNYFYCKKMYKKEVYNIGNTQEFRNHCVNIIGHLIFSKKSEIKLTNEVLVQSAKQIQNIDPMIKLNKFQSFILEGSFDIEKQKVVMALIMCLNIQHNDNFYRQLGKHKPNYIDMCWDILLRNSLKNCNNKNYKKLTLILHEFYYRLNKNINCLLLNVFLYMNPEYLNYQEKIILDHGSIGRIIEESLRVNYFINQRLLKKSQ